ncbi:MAG TPA: TIGR03621 family F420-dependent LLM class oxidoreductase [Acidimicrobiales bacterium]|nr:TIGR03621 family F420-dependent LLM class oxidoreductase [Acidimicrobiales bacterium]
MTAIGFALQTGLSTRAEWLDRARKAEDSGFETLCVADHPGITASPFVALSAAAQVTTRIRLATAVANAGVRDVMQLAGDVATLDVLSEGRAVLGLGAGHTPGEWTTLGHRYPTALQRVGRLIEVVDALTELLSGNAVSFDGQHLHLDGALLNWPRPIQSSLPILIGGNNRELVAFGGRVADIVELTGLGRTLGDGHFHAAQWSDEAIDERVEIFRTVSGARSPAPRLSALVQHVEVTEHRNLAVDRFFDELPAPIRASNLPNAEALSHVPFVMIGSTSELVEELLERRDRWGFTRYTVRWPDLGQLVPLMRRLDEQGELAT